MLVSHNAVIDAVYLDGDADDLSDTQRYFADVDASRSEASNSSVPNVLNDRQLVSEDMLFDRTTLSSKVEPITRRLAEAFTEVCNSFARYHKAGQVSVRAFIEACAAFVHAESEIEAAAGAFSKTSAQKNQRESAYRELRARLSLVVGSCSASMLSRYRRIGGKASLLLQDDILPCLPVSIETLYTLALGPSKDKVEKLKGVQYKDLVHLRDDIEILTPALTRSGLERAWFGVSEPKVASPAEQAGCNVRVTFFFQSEQDAALCLQATDKDVRTFFVDSGLLRDGLLASSAPEAHAVLVKRNARSQAPSLNS